MKDEALTPMGFKMESLPVPRGDDQACFEAQETVERLVDATRSIATTATTILDWLHHEFGLEKPGQTLAQPHLLDADGLVAALRKTAVQRLAVARSRVIPSIQGEEPTEEIGQGAAVPVFPENGSPIRAAMPRIRGVADASSTAPISCSSRLRSAPLAAVPGLFSAPSNSESTCKTAVPDITAGCALSCVARALRTTVLSEVSSSNRLPRRC